MVVHLSFHSFFPVRTQRAQPNEGKTGAGKRVTPCSSRNILFTSKHFVPLETFCSRPTTQPPTSSRSSYHCHASNTLAAGRPAPLPCASPGLRGGAVLSRRRPRWRPSRETAGRFPALRGCHRKHRRRPVRRRRCGQERHAALPSGETAGRILPSGGRG